jgi:hypothetical protein
MLPDNENENKAAAPDASTSTEPPKIYFAACGTLCDIFWWARRNPPAEEPQAPAVSPPTKK